MPSAVLYLEIVETTEKESGDNTGGIGLLVTRPRAVITDSLTSTRVLWVLRTKAPYGATQRAQRKREMQCGPGDELRCCVSLLPGLVDAAGRVLTRELVLGIESGKCKYIEDK